MLSAATGFTTAGTVPKYAPKPGQLLTYEENQSFKGRGEDSRYKTTWRSSGRGRVDASPAACYHATFVVQAPTFSRERSRK